MFKISVIICSHNPQKDYLLKTLTGLRRQTASKKTWELLLIDNASDEALTKKWDVSWHPNGRIIREKKLGLTYARLRGIREAKGAIFIFVDDDNLLDKEYLKEVLKISKAHGNLGAWGGLILPKFEKPPPPWARPFLSLLGLRNFKKDKWSTLYNYETAPIGAGLCIRKHIAEKYLKNLKKRDPKDHLDRSGSSLNSFGDYDLSFTACDLGYGIGQFTKLKLIHLISKKRIELEYLCKLQEAVSYSEQKFLKLRGLELARPKSLFRKIYESLKRLKKHKNHRLLLQAKDKGLKKFFMEERPFKE